METCHNPNDLKKFRNISGFEPTLPGNIKKLLTDRLKYFRRGKAKTFTLEQTIKMLDKK